MVFEKFIRYIGLAVGLKPSATGCEARLRGLYRIMYSKTILPAEMRQGQGALTPRHVGYPRCEQLPYVKVAASRDNSRRARRCAAERPDCPS